jgi:oxygen-independent coproporphyrinogen III oxidase
MTGSISLYIHVPFCTKKCPYCHFFVQKDSQDGQEYFLEMLQKEWLLRSHLLEKGELVSIYFGGGTPSLLSPDAIKCILDWVRKGPFPIAKDCEITLEANPEKTDKNLVKQFKNAGINRISIGIQSFDDGLLTVLGRTHNSLSAKKAVMETYDAGIANISIDLMYELPSQTLLQWENSVKIATSLPITHLSLYNLVFEPGTVFYKKQKSLSSSLPSQEEALAMLDLATEAFKESGLLRYEISAFAKKGCESAHNTGYWKARPFLGIGPSAFSYIKGRRFQNVPHLKKWGKLIEEGSCPEHFTETLNSDRKQRELLAVELRLLKGVDLSNSSPFSDSLNKSINALIAEGFLEKKEATLRLSNKGLNFYDTVASEIV